MTECGSGVNEPGDDEHHNHGNGHDGNDAADVSTGDGVEVICLLQCKVSLCNAVSVDLLAAPSHTDDTGKEQVEAPGPDNGVCTELTDHETINQADHHAGQNTDQCGYGEAQVDELRDHHTGKSHGHGQGHIVHMAGVDNEGQAGGHHALQGNGFQNGLDIAGGKELTLGYQHAQKDQANDDHINAQLIKQQSKRIDLCLTNIHFGLHRCIIRH